MNITRHGKKTERRQSSACPTTTPAPSSDKDTGRRPLTAVLSGDHVPTDNQASSSVRQSFLNKITRADLKKVVEPETVGKAIVSTAASCSSFIYGTECDKTPSDRKNDLDNANQHHQPKDDSDTDDSNQVVPLWPSRNEVLPIGLPKLTQHKVYSLKDYSQVASPTIAPGNQATPSKAIGKSSSGKLLKSMSQERKPKLNAKRMSEANCQTTTKQAQKWAKEQGYPSVSTSSSCLMAPTSSTDLPIPSNPRQAALLSESRINRVRKLFVSPLSLRSSSKNSSNATGSSGNNYHQTASNNPRLSLQSSSAVFNKPHHLMYAVYRPGHPNRRSPLRQKQGKSFRVYGCPLQLAKNIYPITCFGRSDIYKQQLVPYVLARLCNYIEENSSHLTHEGIFRVGGNTRLMEKLKTLFDHLGDAPLELECVDVATSASMLKMYLRELPEPLIPTRMNYYFIALAKKYSPVISRDNISGHNASTTSSTSVTELSPESQASCARQSLAFTRDLTKLVRKLPIENYNLLKYLACFLYRISLKQQYNKMCAKALGIVFGPNIFRIRSESYKGLKEQEFSNQIMASIISNYRSIFDSELIDPLGNIVHGDDEEDDDFLALEGEPSSLDPLPLVHEYDSQTNKENSPGACFPVLVDEVSPIASTSRDSQSDQAHICCPQLCQNYGLDDEISAQHVDFSRADEDSQIASGEAIQGADETGESYTPSSGSDNSYCSSMNSVTIESSCEGDEILDPRDDNGELASQSNISTSDCDSVTSYTPTSSHSDSELQDDADESCFKDSSSFESTHSKNDEFTGAYEEPTRFSRRSCIVCKRRQSAQVDSINRSKFCDIETKDKVKDCENPEDYSSAVLGDQTSDHSVKDIPGSKTQTAPVSNKSLYKKRNDAQRKLEGKSTPPPEIATTSDKLSIAPTETKESTTRFAGEKVLLLDKYTKNNKVQMFKRRSSSTSSLGRMKQRCAQIATAQRKTPKDELHHRTRNQGDKRKSVKGGHNRRFKGKSRSMRKTGSGFKTNPDFAQSTKARRPDKSNDKTEVYLEPDYVSALSITSQLIDEQNVGWSVWSAQCIEEELEDDRYFRLRPFNSDETLLRSLNYSAECVSERTEEPRRRYSGHDFQDKISMVRVCRPCDKIFEALEENLLLNMNDREEYNKSVSANKGNEATILQPVELPIEISFVSLLDNRLSEFRKSELSISNTLQSEDSILIQMRALKDLIRSLKKQRKQGSTLGYNKQIEHLLVNLEEERPLSGDCFAYRVDHLSAQSLTKVLDENLSSDKPASNKVSMIGERINSILDATISLLKHRYNNLKNIHEHILNSHPKSRLDLRSKIGMQSNLSETQSKELHRSLDTLRQSLSSNETKQCLRTRNLSVQSKTTTLDTIIDQRQKSPSSLDGDFKFSNKLIGAGEEKISEDEMHVSNVKRSSCQFGALCPVEFVFNIERQLESKRLLGCRAVKLDEMSLEQLQGEKLELQKNLLRYEHWFGRPLTKFEFSLVGHIYERYRAMKLMIKKVKEQEAA